MESKKREESKEEITVLDEGIGMDEMVEARGICCRAVFFPFRG